MKSLQNDVATADKEISVRQIHQICIYLKYQRVMVVIPACTVVHRVWRRKWSFFRGLWAPRQGQMKPSVGSCLKGVSPSYWTEISSCFRVVFYENKLCVIHRWRFLCSSFSPAPMELKQPRLHEPADSHDIDLNMTYDVTTPDDVAKRPTQFQPKKMRLDPSA